jgi:hypothetical protein
MEKVSVYMKINIFLSLTISGAILGTLYLISFILLLNYLPTYLEEHDEIFRQIYLIYLPLASLLASFIFKQVKFSITLSAAMLTGGYLYYLIEHMTIGF